MRTNLFLSRLKLNECSMKIVVFVRTNRLISCSNVPKDTKRISKICSKLRRRTNLREGISKEGDQFRWLFSNCFIVGFDFEACYQ